MRLKAAIQRGDADGLVALAGHDLMTKENLRYALDSSFFGEFGSDARSMRDIMSEGDCAVIIEAARVGARWVANVYFVPMISVKRSRPPFVSQLEGLRLMRDYAACELVDNGRGVEFPSHFCFSETDVFESIDG